MSRYIVNDNDIFVLFEVVKQTSPRSILDLGMFLKRIGAISRQVKDAEIPETVRLDAYTDTPQSLKVYEKVYNNIFLEEPSFKYDLVIWMHLNDVFSDDSQRTLLKWIQNHSRNVLMDEAYFKQMKARIRSKSFNSLQTEGDKYVLLHF